MASSNSTWIVGVDPGLNGALAFWNGLEAVFEDMPTVEGVNKRRIDENALVAIFSVFDVEHAFVENVHAMPKQGVASACSFCGGAGIIRGVLAGLRIPRTYVEPVVWKRAMGLPVGAPKDASRHRAGELAPLAAPHLKRKKDDGRAEALLLAIYGERQLRA